MCYCLPKRLSTLLDISLSKSQVAYHMYELSHHLYMLSSAYLYALVNYLVHNLCLSSAPIIHTYHLRLSFTPIIHTYHSRLSFAHLSCAPVMRTCHAHLACRPIIHHHIFAVTYLPPSCIPHSAHLLNLVVYCMFMVWRVFHVSVRLVL